jgi:hypothetical protein
VQIAPLKGKIKGQARRSMAPGLPERLLDVLLAAIDAEHQARAWIQESADAKRAAGDERGMTRRLNLLGLYRMAEGEVAAGRAAP